MPGVAGLAGRRALPTLTRSAGRYYGVSKGKKLKEGETEGIILPREALDAIQEAGLDGKRPFAALNADAIEQRVNYYMRKLYQDGTICGKKIITYDIIMSYE
jgi:hypothetical protein